MRMLFLIKKRWLSAAFACLLMCCISPVLAAANADEDNITMDRVQLVSEQIKLLKNRLTQGEQELAELQKQHDKEFSELTLEKATKSLLDKASLDISVAKSNVDSITIELTDSQQTRNWLEKNIQEIENQLNVLGMFGIKVANHEVANVQDLRADLNYQTKLLALEKNRADNLRNLETIVSSILQIRKEKYDRLNTLLKSRKMLHIKQQQVKDELAYQEQQNAWLQTLNNLYARLTKLDPVKERDSYAALERDIYFANESANFAYSQSLIARYRDQTEQMKLVVMKSSSISLLNEISDQMQTLTKQINRLQTVLKSRISVLDGHVSYLAQRKKGDTQFAVYLQKLSDLENRYKASEQALVGLQKSIQNFRVSLDHAIQVELSSRQGFPTFSIKAMLDLGKEILLVPALTFQITKSLSNHLVGAFKVTSIFGWTIFALGECMLIAAFLFLRKMIKILLLRPSQWRDQINSRWISLQLLRRNLFDLLILGNIMGLMMFFDVPPQNYRFLVYLSLVWLGFKSIMTIARLCLVETTHDARGHDMRLYRRLKWVIIVGGVITALTVFAHQLPLIYEIKTLCDRSFLLLLMIVSLFLLRSSDVVPHLILSHMESQHPYLQKSIRLIGVLIPLLMFGNAVIGLIGFVNLIMTVSWYEGIFMIVLIGYLILRGLLSDTMEQLSRLMIQYVNNGWLWTEAFLKPLDKILRISLFFAACAVLFLLYGWDRQSPIVINIVHLLQYKLINTATTSITAISLIELFVVISVFYWTAKWTREFVYRLLLSRTQDMGIRNSIAILSQYCVIMLGLFICLRVLGIDLRAVVAVTSLFALGIGFGLRDLANNFVCGFLILLERPLRVGDIVSVNGIEGDVMHIGGRAVTVRTWDHMELFVPNSEIFSKSFINWTARDNIVRSVIHVKISRYDNPHEVKLIILNVLAAEKDILKDPAPEVYLKVLDDNVMDFEVRYYVNIRQVKSRTYVISSVLMKVWDAFGAHDIKPPYPQHEVFLRGDMINGMSALELPRLSDEPKLS